MDVFVIRCVLGDIEAMAVVEVSVRFTGDSVQVGHRRLFRIQALRDFGQIRRGDVGGYIERESNLSHDGDSWVADVAQVYGPHGSVRGNGRVSGEA
jgi:hypothetical protein